MNNMVFYAASAVIGVGAAMAVENDLHKNFMGAITNSYAQETPSSRSEMIDMLIKPISEFPMIADNHELGQSDYREYATCLVNEANAYVNSGNRMRYADGSRLSLINYYDLVYTYITEYRHPTWGMTEIQVRDVYLNIYAYCNKYVTTNSMELRRLDDQADTMRKVFDFKER